MILFTTTHREFVHHVIFNSNKMKKLFFITTIFCFTLSVMAQEQNNSTLKKAEDKFEDYNYSEAINKYAEANDGSPEVTRKLAESFFRIGNIEKAEILYGKLANADVPEEKDVYMYAYTLMQNKKYPEALEMMSKYSALNPEDSRATAVLQNENYIEQLLMDKGQFTIKNLTINSPQEDFSPVFYKDKVLFASSREGVKPIRRKWNWNRLPFLDIYEASVNADGELANANPFRKELNKKFHEGPVAFNSAQTSMAFTRNNYEDKSSDNVVKLKIFISEFVDGKWQNPVAFPLNNKEYSVGHPAYSSDGKWLYFASDMPGGFGGVDLYKIPLNADGSFGEPINLGERINTEGNEMFPTFHESGMLFYSSDGKAGLGGLDLFVVQVKEDGSVGKQMNVGAPINSSRDDFSFSLNKDMTYGYFASNREEGKGDDDIYFFEMLKPFNFGKILQGVAKDKKGNILAETKVNLLDDKGNVIESIVTGEKGNYSFLVEENKKYQLVGSKEKYFEGTNTASTFTDEQVVYADVALQKDPGLSLYALVVDKKTKQPLENVKMTIIDNLTGKETVYYTPASGDYRNALANKQINDRGSYNITLEKSGYFGKTVTFNTLFDKPGVYEIHKSLDLTLDKLEVGGDISKLIEINPIYFDFNKANIRPDAALELDKIVKVMNDYPGMVIELGSHTDSRGSDAYNIKLSDRRAKSSAQYIKEQITNPSRIYGKGYGETKLINQCSNGVKCTDEEHQENRRTEFIIIKLDADVKVNNSSPNSF
jgi:outer membrane protein OmpA-like peptidoglycan-associated protein/tetratricopeptide (TPR) repeat protein